MFLGVRVVHDAVAPLFFCLNTFLSFVGTDGTILVCDLSFVVAKLIWSIFVVQFVAYIALRFIAGRVVLALFVVKLRKISRENIEKMIIKNRPRPSCARGGA